MSAARVATVPRPVPVPRSSVPGDRVRTLALVAVNVVGVLAFIWPFVLPLAPGVNDEHRVDGPVILFVLLGSLGLLLFVELSRGGMGPKTVALLGVLGAAMVALRLPGFVAGFSAMFIVVLLAGNAFGPSFGWLLGAIGTFASGLFVGGLGPWLPFQMVAVGWVGMGAGLLPRHTTWPRRIGALAAYGFVVGYAFGALMNLWSWPFLAGSSNLGWDPSASAAENLRHYAAFYAVTSLAWDTFRAVGNALLVLVLGRPLLATLDRAARKLRLELGSVRTLDDTGVRTPEPRDVATSGGAWVSPTSRRRRRASGS
jgi:energy-coupling factor transport system substrate-specific component